MCDLTLTPTDRGQGVRTSRLKHLVPMMRAAFVLLCLVVFGPIKAQNLVPNASFEVYTICPEVLNQMGSSVGWSRFRGSPDYFNACDQSPHVGVPLNWMGWQNAATGVAYAGSYLWCDFPENTRELLGIALSEPLQPGVPVYISFRVSPTTGGALESMRWTIAGVGMRFSVNQYVHDTGLEPLPNNAAVMMNEAPMDTSQWYVVSGVYVPDSAYSYAVIGNFLSDSLVMPVMLNSEGNIDCAYVYYDEVCVSYSPLDCIIGQGLEESVPLDRPLVYPLPFVDRCTVSFDRAHTEPAFLHLRNATGEVVWTGVLPAGQRKLELSVSNLAGGLYFLHSTNSAGAMPSVVLMHVTP